MTIEAGQNEVRKAFDRAVYGAERRAWIIGLMGMVNTDGTTTIDVPDRQGWVYVSTGPSGNQVVTIARNDGKVSRRAQMPVKMKRDEDGALVIYGVFNAGGFTDSGMSGDYTNNFGVEWHHHRIGSGLEFEMEGLLQEAARVLPTGGMNVQLNSFRYYRASGWSTFLLETFDVTSYKPATSGHWAWVVIGVDPDTNLATATTGTSVPYATALEVADIDNVPFEGIPIVAIKVRDDQVSIADMSTYADAHEWFTGLHVSYLGDLDNVDESSAYYGGAGPYWNDELYYYGYGGYGWVAGGHKVNMGAVKVHTVSTGTINIQDGPTFGLLELHGEGDANDDLEFIQNGQVGDVVCLFSSNPVTYGEITVKTTGNINLDTEFTIDTTSKVLILIFTPSGWKQMSGASGGTVNATVAIPKSFDNYIDKKERLAQESIHGALVSISIANALDSVPTDINDTVGVGKVFVAVIAGSDTDGMITVTGTTVDRDTGVETPADTDTINVSGVTTDSSGTDSNGNVTHAFTNGYITNKWFKGAIVLSTANLTLTDVDVYQAAFEQFGDTSGITLDILDYTALANNASAWCNIHLYSMHIDGDTCSITKEASVGIDAADVTANTKYRLREGNIASELDGLTDGIWVESFLGPLANVYWEDISYKVWYTQLANVTGTLVADLDDYVKIVSDKASIPNGVTKEEVLNVHEPSTNGAYVRFTNTDTGTAAGAGMRMGMSQNGVDATACWNYEDGTVWWGTNNTTMMALNDTGLGILYNNPPCILAMGGDTILLTQDRSPASGGTGTRGMICKDTNYLYVCTATNTWKRVALTGGY